MEQKINKTTIFSVNTIVMIALILVVTTFVFRILEFAPFPLIFLEIVAVLLLMAVLSYTKEYNLVAIMLIGMMLAFFLDPVFFSMTYGTSLIVNGFVALFAILGIAAGYIMKRYNLVRLK